MKIDMYLPLNFQDMLNTMNTGKDLVCAGASTIAIGTVNAIYALLNIEPKIEQATEGGGYLKVDVANGYRF